MPRGFPERSLWALPYQAKHQCQEPNLQAQEPEQLPSALQNPGHEPNLEPPE